MAVTSQIQPKTTFGETVITDWQIAGLLKPSVIKPIVFTAEKSIIKKLWASSAIMISWH
jgi:mRNA interferase MazF